MNTSSPNGLPTFEKLHHTIKQDNDRTDIDMPLSSMLRFLSNSIASPSHGGPRGCFWLGRWGPRYKDPEMLRTIARSLNDRYNGQITFREDLRWHSIEWEFASEL